MLNVRVAWPWPLGPALPILPEGYVFLTDDWGVYLTDDDGNYLVAERDDG